VSASNNKFSPAVIATATLTRAYGLTSLLRYRFLVRRNRSIVRVLLSRSEGIRFDHWVFHEGNLRPLARIGIRIASWPLRLKFVDLEEFFNNFKKERAPETLKRCPETPLSSRFSIGYRAMCAFWTNEFLAYLGDYDVVFRIDEDCVLKSLDFDTVFKPLIEGSVDYCAGTAFGLDAPDVTRGFEQFVIEWHERNPETRAPTFDHNPYTNLFLLRPQALRSNPGAINFLSHVRSSGCILSNRWGDHVIWGSVLSMYGETIKSNLDAEISYFHGSHSAMVSHG
jgi:hypothetical protein